MPPKKRPDGKDKQKKEDAERKAREEEENRRAAEQERLEQEQRMAEAREERRRQKEEERVRFQHVTEILGQELEARRIELEKWKAENLEKLQWEEYVSCSDIPNPSSERTMNTYLSLAEEDDKCVLIQDIMAITKDWLRICDRIEQLMHGDALPEPSAVEKERYRKIISRFRTLIFCSLDRATLHYMGDAEKHVDSETFNLTLEAGLGQRLKFCLWGNVVKDPRLKSFSFKDQLKFTLELPKSLLLADVAIRIIQMDFDPLSPISSSYNYKTLARSGLSTGLSEISASMIMDDDEGTPFQEEAGTRGGSPWDGAIRSNVPSSTRLISGNMTESASIKEAGEGRADTGVITSRTVLDQADDEVQKAGVTIAVTESEQLQTKDSAMLGEDEIDLRAFRPAGGPLFLQALELPPQPKVVNNWTIKKVLPQLVPVFAYPVVVARPASPSSLDVVEPAAPIPGSAAWPAIGISMDLPQPYIYGEEPQVARWDEKEKIWRTKGILNVEYNMDEKTVSFQTFYFSPLAVMVDQYANMPYASWEMLPRGVNHTLLTIEGGIISIAVQIKKELCTLVGPDDQPAFSHLLNIPMSSRQLINALKLVGANFFPEEDGWKYVSVTKKRPAVEMECYHSMALASSGYGFQWSRFNADTSPAKMVMQVAEAKGNDELVWKLFVGGKKGYRLEVTEDSDAFSPERAPDALAHPGLYAALEHEASPEVKEILKNTGPMHQESVRHWLTSTKVLTFA